MDRETIFICHTSAQKQAVCEVLKQRGESVSENAWRGDMRFPVMLYDEDYRLWVGYPRHARRVRVKLEEGYKVIDLNESSTRGGY